MTIVNMVGGGDTTNLTSISTPYLVLVPNSVSSFNASALRTNDTGTYTANAKYYTTDGTYKIEKFIPGMSVTQPTYTTGSSSYRFKITSNDLFGLDSYMLDSSSIVGKTFTWMGATTTLNGFSLYDHISTYLPDGSYYVYTRGYLLDYSTIPDFSTKYSSLKLGYSSAATALRFVFYITKSGSTITIKVIPKYAYGYEDTFHTSSLYIHGRYSRLAIAFVPVMISKTWYDL